MVKVVCTDGQLAHLNDAFVFVLASTKKSSSLVCCTSSTDFVEDDNNDISSSPWLLSNDVREGGFGLTDGLDDELALIEDFLSDFLLRANKSSPSSSTLERNRVVREIDIQKIDLYMHAINEQNRVPNIFFQQSWKISQNKLFLLIAKALGCLIKKPFYLF